jgi:hypothetical protein
MNKGRLKKLVEALTDTGIKENCRINPKFRQAFFADIKEQGYSSNIVALCECIIDN